MSHDHDDHHTAAPINRMFGIAIGINLLFIAVEAFYGLKVNSLALLADAGHNLSDVAGLVLRVAAAQLRKSNVRYCTQSFCLEGLKELSLDKTT